MQGEFRGDFTRDTFNPGKHFLRVLTQQGRVQLDADPNEQSSIIIHYLQSLAVDLMGSHAAPFEGGGFEVKKSTDITDGFTISKGRYYVNGTLCENILDDVPYFKQPYLPKSIPTPLESPIKEKGNYLIHLDVWERHINYIQDEISSGNDLQNPSIREVALMGADTATRSQIVWQVKIKLFTDEELKKVINPPATDLDLAVIGKAIKDEYSTVFLNALGESIKHPGRGTGKLKARAKKSDETISDPCIVNPSSSYNGNENQLYRVEIHQEGKAKKDGNQTIATFKWSRENSSVVFPIRQLVPSSGSSPTITITLAHLGQEDRFTLQEQEWVEIVDDDYIFQNNPNDTPLFKIDSIDRDEQTIVLRILSGKISNGIGQNLDKHPFLRRWDRDEQTATVSKDNNAVQDVEEGEDKWLPLENGIEICFPPNTEKSPAVYRKGDYWLIPARTATGDVEWPGTVDNPSSLPPHGIVHNYAPLALISVDAEGKISANDCRRILKQQWE
jgi:Family of unknown function (DUF6519)